ncbi:MAG TPA: methyltransferase domain-containing protein [Pyrinomonadaceae bacterium]|jgi:SAM-dependent methyltransferase|nr:methyltransferase domain-containing protein [Pyrinomonadaceae bacterium]
MPVVKSVRGLVFAFVLVALCVRLPLTSAQAERRHLRRRAAAAQRREPRAPRRSRRPDVLFVPTPPETVAEMLCLAEIRDGDVLYDLGSGDGRIPITAAERYGIRAVGIDIDPEMVAVARGNARRAGVTERVSFLQEDLYQADIGEATVVTLYLSDGLNLLLRPKLLRELRPGTRIISHDFRMGDWKPEQTVRVNWRNLYRTIYVWTIPERGHVKRRNGAVRTAAEKR